MARATNANSENSESNKTNKKYMVINNNKDDSVNGIHYCNVNGKKYQIQLNKSIVLDPSVYSYLTNAKMYHIPGIDLTDENSIIDISKQTFHTEVKNRFDVVEM